MLLRGRGQDKDARLLEQEIDALWRGRSPAELVDLAIRQAVSANVIGYGKTKLSAGRRNEFASRRSAPAVLATLNLAKSLGYRDFAPSGAGRRQTTANSDAQPPAWARPGATVQDQHDREDWPESGRRRRCCAMPCEPYSIHLFTYIRRFKTSRKDRRSSVTSDGPISFLKGRDPRTRSITLREAVMSDKEPHEKPAPNPDKKAEQKTSETVHLSAEELRKISGGQAALLSLLPPQTSN